MIPEQRLSTTPVPGTLLGARGSQPVTATHDYEDGGIALNDPSRGLQFQVWEAYLQNNNIVLQAPGYPATVIYTGTGEITEVSLSFDQNMRPTIAFVEGGQAKLRWFDSVPGEQVITVLDPDVVNPRVSLDDKHPLGVPASDVILAYRRLGGLYFRALRDRYTIEYLLEASAPAELVKIGLSDQYRLQFEFAPA